MKTYILSCFLVIISLPSLAQEKIRFEKPALEGEYSLEELLWQRRSVRTYQDKTPSWEHIGKLLWAAQGINRPESGGRTSPSAWSAYPLDVYVIVDSGVYHYMPEKHAVEQIKDYDIRDELEDAGLARSNVHNAPCVFVFTAEIDRLTPYCEILGDGLRYIHQESGHAAQNLILQAGTLGIGCVPIGANIPLKGQQIIGIPPEQKSVYILATGYRKKSE